LSSVAYATTPPRTAAEEPGTLVRAAATSPPVSDSAVATVSSRAIRSSIAVRASAPMRGPETVMTIPARRGPTRPGRPVHHRWGRAQQNLLRLPLNRR
jgi:hypothetical protein